MVTVSRCPLRCACCPGAAQAIECVLADFELRTNGRIDRRIDERRDRRIDGRIDERIEGQKDERINGRLDERIEERI